MTSDRKRPAKVRPPPQNFLDPLLIPQGQKKTFRQPHSIRRGSCPNIPNNRMHAWQTNITLWRDQHYILASTSVLLLERYAATCDFLENDLPTHCHPYTPSFCGFANIYQQPQLSASKNGAPKTKLLTKQRY